MWERANSKRPNLDMRSDGRSKHRDWVACLTDMWGEMTSEQSRRTPVFSLGTLGYFCTCSRRPGRDGDVVTPCWLLCSCAIQARARRRRVETLSTREYTLLDVAFGVLFFAWMLHTHCNILRCVSHHEESGGRSVHLEKTFLPYLFTTT
jgi:hypothetical protein